MRAVASVLSSALCPSFFTLSLQVLTPSQSEHVAAFHCPDGSDHTVCAIRGVSTCISLPHPWQMHASSVVLSHAHCCSPLIPGLAPLACFVCRTLSALLPPSLDRLLVLHVPICLDPCLSNHLRRVFKHGFKSKIHQIISLNTSNECQDSRNTNAKTFPNAETLCRP